MSRYRLTTAADEDIDAILRETTRLFGPKQRNRYAEIIQIGIDMVASEPERPGSRSRLEIHAETRSFHLELAAGRLGSAAHQIFYIRHRFDNGDEGVIILRGLHEKMEPRHHISRIDL
jgi:toxin ParE1/3/4